VAGDFAARGSRIEELPDENIRKSGGGEDARALLSPSSSAESKGAGSRSAQLLLELAEGDLTKPLEHSAVRGAASLERKAGKKGVSLGFNKAVFIPLY